MDRKTRAKLEELREFVWLKDIPHPTVPEYVELHTKMSAILKFIDGILKEAGREHDTV